MTSSPLVVAFDAANVIVTESRPGEVLAALHQSAEADSEYLFAARDASPDDLILVAWSGDTALGYIATTDLRDDGMLLWEHLVVPSHRTRGLGRRLLFEAARRAVATAVIEIDPLGQLDLERVGDYYRHFGFHHNLGVDRLSATAGDVVRSIARNHRTVESRTTVGELLKKKPAGVFTVRPDQTVRDAIGVLNTQRIGAVVVTADGTHISGILSERDVLFALAEGDQELLDRTVDALDTTDVVTCTTGDPIGAAMDLMTRRHLPITDEGRLVGLISPGDVVKFRLDAVEAAAYLDQAGFFDD
jgi:CBS domain-containing protein/GNAT superfamily N-acetyltransferase